MSQARNDVFEIEVPEPLAKFGGSPAVIHPKNATLLSGQEYARILSRSQLKRARKLYMELKAKLTGQQPRNRFRFRRKTVVTPDYLELNRERQRLYAEFRDSKVQYLNLKKALDDTTAHDQQVDIKQQMQVLTENGASIAADLRIVDKQLLPMLAHIRRFRALENRIDEHRQAMADERLNQHLRADLAKEANYLAEMIIKTYNRLKYCYEVSVSAGRGRTQIKRDSVKFERIVVTPDSVQFKIDVSKLGLFGGTIHNLPTGVRGYDLVKPETLIELSIAIERQVTSPHFDGDAHNFQNGAWIEVHRLGLTDGLMNYVTYTQIMSQWNPERRLDIPLPLGVKRGRHVNWVYLSEWPHIFVTGQTGKGKSNTINLILSLLVSMYTPAEIQLVMIDLKFGTELYPYRSAPHLVAPVVTEVDDVMTTLGWVMQYLQKRMLEIRSYGAQNIVQYNQRVVPDKRMSRLIVVYDEFAMSELGDSRSIKAMVDHIAATGRAAGIHLIISTQVPYSDVVNKLTKSNLGVMIGGQQSNLGASMSAFGDSSAKKIANIPGRMLVKVGTDVYPVQMPHVLSDDIANAIALSMENEKPAHPLLEVTDMPSPELLLKPFNADDVIRIAIEELDGRLASRRIWEWTKDNDSRDISSRNVDDLVKQLKTRDQIDFDGKSYELVKVGRAYDLVEIMPLAEPQST